MENSNEGSDVFIFPQEVLRSVVYVGVSVSVCSFVGVCVLVCSLTRVMAGYLENGCWR